MNRSDQIQTPVILRFETVTGHPGQTQTNETVANKIKLFLESNEKSNNIVRLKLSFETGQERLELLSN